MHFYPNNYHQKYPFHPPPPPLPSSPPPVHSPALGLQYAYNDELRKEMQHKQMMERYQNKINSNYGQPIPFSAQQPYAAHSYEQALSEFKNNINKEVTQKIETTCRDFGNLKLKYFEEYIEAKYSKLFNDFLANFSKELIESESKALENLSLGINSLDPKNINSNDISSLFGSIKEISKKIKNEGLLQKLNEETLNFLNFTINMNNNQGYHEKLSSDVKELEKQNRKNSSSLKKIIDEWEQYKKTFHQKNEKDLAILSQKQEEMERKIKNLEEKMNHSDTCKKKKQKLGKKRKPRKCVNSARNALFEIIKKRYNFQMAGEGRKFRNVIYYQIPLEKLENLFNIFKHNVVEIMNEWKNTYNFDYFFKQNLLKWIAMKNIIFFLNIPKYHDINGEEWHLVEFKIKQLETNPYEVLSYVLNPFFDSLIFKQNKMNKPELMHLAQNFIKKDQELMNLINLDWVKNGKTIKSEKFRILTANSNVKVIDNLLNNVVQKENFINVIIPVEVIPLLKQEIKEEI